MSSSPDQSTPSRRFAVEPRAQTLIEQTEARRTVIVTKGRGRLIAAGTLVNDLREGDVTPIHEGSYTVVNSCDRDPLLLLLV